MYLVSNVSNASRLLLIFYVTSIVPLTLTHKYNTFIFLNHNLETLDLREIESSIVLKLSPVIKRWGVRGDSFGTCGMCPLRQLTSGGRFLHVAKRSPHAQIYDSGQNFRGDNLFRDTGALSCWNMKYSDSSLISGRSHCRRSVFR